jgi:hypothetical protein
MAVKRMIYEICRTCGEVDARVEGNRVIWPLCRCSHAGPIPSPPRAVPLESVIFVPAMKPGFELDIEINRELAASGISGRSQVISRAGSAQDQYRLLTRIESSLNDAQLAAGQLPGGKPLLDKIADALRLASAWRCDQEAELPEPRP